MVPISVMCIRAGVGTSALWSVSTLSLILFLLIFAGNAPAEVGAQKTTAREYIAHVSVPVRGVCQCPGRPVDSIVFPANVKVQTVLAVADPVVSSMHQVSEAHGVTLHSGAGVVGGQADKVKDLKAFTQVPVVFRHDAQECHPLLANPTVWPFFAFISVNAFADNAIFAVLHCVSRAGPSH